MSICACCNMVLVPDWAYENTLCPVCKRAGCTSQDARHRESHREAHLEQRREDDKQEAAREQRAALADD